MTILMYSVERTFGGMTVDFCLAAVQEFWPNDGSGSGAAFEIVFSNPTLETLNFTSCFNLARSLVMSNGGLDQ